MWCMCMHATQPAELVLCRIQKTRTGSDVEEEIISYNENQSSLNIARHQATLMSRVPVQVPVPSDHTERPRSKRLKRDNTNAGTQDCSTSAALMAPTATAETETALPMSFTSTPTGYQQYQHCYNTSTDVPDHYNYTHQQQQQYYNTNNVPDQHQYFNNTISSVPHQQQQQQQHQQQQQQQQQQEQYYVQQHASETGNEKGDDFGDDRLGMIDLPSPSVLVSHPDWFKLDD